MYLKKFTDHLYKTASTDLLDRVLVMLSSQQQLTLQEDFSRIIATRILDKTIPPKLALKIADRHGLRLLRGAAYYSILFFGTNKTVDGKLEPKRFEAVGSGYGADAKLQRLLLHGYWSLAQYSQILVNTPPLTTERCKTLKITQWHRLYVPNYSPTVAHPLAMLEECKQGLVAYIDSSCGVDRGLVVKEIELVIRQFRDRLMDHFDSCF
jgi:hypothetical protein